jgi:hypothetical protein
MPDDDPDPRDVQLSRRSRTPSLTPWGVVVGAVILVALVYVLFALN